MTAEDRIREIHKGVQDIRENMAKAIVHQEQHRKELDGHSDRLDNLDARKNKADGIIATIGIFFGALAAWIVQHLLHK